MSYKKVQRPREEVGSSTGEWEDDTPPSMEYWLQGHIGRQLKAYYGELVSEPVPERFVELLVRFQEELEQMPGDQSPQQK